jgi:hypothetical protein
MTAQSSEMGQSPATPEGFIDKHEVARRLNKTVRTVDNWMARGTAMKNIDNHRRKWEGHHAL